ncbi:hypothetical protein [Herbidospora mongoliensis]|uniref:hypothetical protein n=1 Tax=Herbidospora mongoliensis TaxID=688067 RepID=UPI000AD27319|nr:hypothetical protein [Herbidospora mongoliensis]
MRHDVPIGEEYDHVLTRECPCKPEYKIVTRLLGGGRCWAVVHRDVEGQVTPATTP